MNNNNETEDIEYLDIDLDELTQYNDNISVG